MLITKWYFAATLALHILVAPVSSLADDEAPPRNRTAEERRDSGKKHQIAEWLVISPELEFEYTDQAFNPFNAPESSLTENSKSLQLEFEISPTDWLNAEIVYEYDDVLDEFVLDESFAEFEVEDFTVQAGKFYVPFGEYYNRFITDPLIEYAEIRAHSVMLSYESDDQLEAALFIFKSKLDRTTVFEDKYDWGFSVNYTPVDTITTGLSYVSDLSESEENLLEGYLVYQNVVDAIAVYANFEFEDFETSIELIQALDSFTELDADRNKPTAWNLEFTFSPSHNIQLALRVEGSEELEDAAERQIAVNGTYYVTKNIIAAIEVAEASYKKGFAEDLNENELDRQTQIAAEVTITF